MSLCPTLIISVETLKKVCGQNDGIEDRKILTGLESAQLTLKKILGITGYDTLIAAIEADATLATEADLKTLVDDYLCRYLAWQGYWDAIPGLHSEANKRAFSVQSDDNFTPVGSDILHMHSERAKKNAQDAFDVLMLFLCNNTATYTWFNTNTSQDQRLTHKYAGGIVTRKFGTSAGCTSEFDKYNP